MYPIDALRRMCIKDLSAKVICTNPDDADLIPQRAIMANLHHLGDALLLLMEHGRVNARSRDIATLTDVTAHQKGTNLNPRAPEPSSRRMPPC
jgi:hypothetical protein